MRKLLIVGAVGIAAWLALGRDVDRHDTSSGSSFDDEQFPRDAAESQQLEEPLLLGEQTRSSDFKCDGRTYCSQMTSCAEAKYFLKNCPGVKMDGARPGEDGPGDGIPCESQWCGDR